MKALGIEAKTFTNTKTGEELSVNILKDDEIEIKEIEIKRARKETKKKKNN